MGSLRLQVAVPLCYTRGHLLQDKTTLQIAGLNFCSLKLDKQGQKWTLLRSPFEQPEKILEFHFSPSSFLTDSLDKPRNVRRHCLIGSTYEGDFFSCGALFIDVEIGKGCVVPAKKGPHLSH
jgi:hypothetical protein